jgi:GNAT superfamily N-acetyltransferase
MKYKITRDRDIVEKYQKMLGDESWPEFMQHDEIVGKNWHFLYERYPEFQYAVFDNKEIIGIGNTIPVHWDKPFEQLPDTGLDWAFEKANKDYQSQIDPNLIIAVQILINKDYRGKGISFEMVKIMKELAYNCNFKNIALPIRPTLKYKFPLIPMQDYIQWKNEDDEAFDPWIRVHLKKRGRIVGVCNCSMNITGTIKEWEEWTGLKFPGSGNYIIKGALAEISINKELDKGIYLEPNVWMIHKCDQKE